MAGEGWKRGLNEARGGGVRGGLSFNMQNPSEVNLKEEAILISIFIRADFIFHTRRHTAVSQSVHPSYYASTSINSRLAKKKTSSKAKPPRPEKCDCNETEPLSIDADPFL